MNKFGLLILLAGLAVILFLAIRQDRKLEQNFKITAAIVSGIDGATGNGNRLADYTYAVNGKSYTRRSSLPCSSIPCIKYYRNAVVGKKFLVVYQADNPSNSRMIFTNNDLKHFKINPTLDVQRAAQEMDSVVAAHGDEW
ncbi:hypothetical protein [Flaviaesturariibacter amylovorans]|uniref:DUF3592 domain-containing protein n=1 Tax=Flaviaesturariibacter amylovorans TaxID=1084520 RepID=A0ABP8G3P9_9BACT